MCIFLCAHLLVAFLQQKVFCFIFQATKEESLVRKSAPEVAGSDVEVESVDLDVCSVQSGTTNDTNVSMFVCNH